LMCLLYILPELLHVLLHDRGNWFRGTPWYTVCHVTSQSTAEVWEEFWQQVWDGSSRVWDPGAAVGYGAKSAINVKFVSENYRFLREKYCPFYLRIYVTVTWGLGWHVLRVLPLDLPLLVVWRGI